MDDQIYWRDEKVEVPPAIDWSILGDLQEPGIYFDMPEDEYHAVPALSNSGIKNLVTSPMDFWARSWMNPDLESEDTEAKDLGKAYDCRIMDGRDTFFQKYGAQLEAIDYPNALRTVDEIKEVLKYAGLSTKGNKPELVERLLSYDPNAEIWDTLKVEHYKANLGKDLIPFEQIKKIELAAAMIEGHPDIKKAFTGGYPQVAIFWFDENGVPMKSRLDYLKVKAIVDLKTFSNSQRKPIDRAVTYAIASYRYHIQVAVYQEAVTYAKGFVKEGRVFGEADPTWLKQFAESEEHTFMFVFQQTGIAPVVRGYVFPKMLAYDCGKIEVRDAKAIFVQYVEHFGASPWVDMTPVRSLDDSEFPAFMTAGS